jgi:hypothetical protein
MQTSPRLGLAYVQPQQAQKHVTVNESFRRLDALAQLVVASASLAAEPAAPAEGDAYILPASPSGPAWAGFAAGAIAVFQDGAWTDIAPETGWRAWVVDAAQTLVFAGGGWTPPQRVGVNTTADATNRLAVKSDAVLFSHDDAMPGSGDARVKVNKASAGAVASHLFQTGFSGRAEFGLTGDDDFHIKVSPDGSSWKEALVISKDTGFIGVNGASPELPLCLSSAGVAAGSGPLMIEGQGNAERITIHSVGANATPQFQGRAATGTLAAPGATSAGMRLFGLGGSGHDGSAFVTSMAALIEMNADAAWTATSHPTRISLKTTPSGSVASAGGVERMRITSAGNVGIGLAAPAVKLDVDGPVRVRSYAKAALPAASAGAGQIIYVPDEAGGAVLAFSDGTSWRRTTDRAVVS